MAARLTREPRAAQLTLAISLVAVVWLYWDAMHPVFKDLDMYHRIGLGPYEGTYWKDPYWNTGPPFFQVFVMPVVVFYQLVPSVGMRLALVFFWNLALSIAVTSVSVRSLAASIDDRGRTVIGPVPAVIYICAWLCTLPLLRANFHLQQINLVPTLLCVLAFARLGRRRDDSLAGVLTGLAASIKVAPVVLLPYFWRRWRTLGAALATGAVLAVIPALIYGIPTLINAWRFWLFESIPAQKGAREILNISVPGLMHRLVDQADPASVREFNTVLLNLGPGWAEALGALIGFGAVALLYFAIWRGPKKRAPMADLAVLLPAANLAGAVAWQHHLVSLLPAYALILIYLTSSSGGQRRKRAVAAMLGASLALSYLQFLHGPQAIRALWIGANAFGSVTISAYLAILAALLARNDNLYEPGTLTAPATPQPS
ncbi:MAG: hypothetical protein DCC49_06360 [Acidobacteria bacterium]|nr:MAG: hypothetical protein DCC49_06360 [Acidobacteriota bacterium]